MKPNIRYGIKCANPICGSKMAHDRSVSYFSFPKDPARCAVWIKHCGLTVPLAIVIQKQFKLCGKHFETKMFLNDLRNRLQPNAIPTLLANDIPPSISRQLLFDDRDGSSIDCDMPNVSAQPLDLETSDFVESNIIVPTTPTSDTDSLCSSSMSTNQTFSSNETITTLSNSSSKAVQTLKSWSDNTPRKKTLVAKYKMEKAARIDAEKAVVTLTNQLASLNTEENFNIITL